MRAPTYALYRGDELLGIGTATQLAKEHGCKRETIMWYSYPANMRRINGSHNRLYATRLEDDDA